MFDKIVLSVVATLILVACSPSTVDAEATLALSESPATTEASTISTEIPSSTQTETVVVIDEHDIKPINVQEVLSEFMGVKLKTNLITDYSLSISNPAIRKVTLSDNVALEYVARIVFTAYWYHGNTEHSEKPEEVDFREFMQLWSEAQRGEGSWEDVQFTIYANDLNDGNGYQQRKFTFWPMTEKVSAEGVRSFNQLNIVFVRSSRVENITITSEAFNDGFGTNLDGNNLDFYTGLSYGTPGDARNPIVQSGPLQALAWWLRYNDGNLGPVTIDNTHEFPNRIRSLILNGLRISPPPG